MATTNANHKCPVDRAYLGIRVTTTKSNVLENIIKEKKIMCPTTLSGNGRCCWQGVLGDLEQHNTTCEMQIVKCPNDNCQASTYRFEEEHHMNECPHRLISCKDCNESIPVNGGHSSVCTKKFNKCPNNCGEQVQRY
ncbi:TNF receptor-associated factor 4 [Exaiptasia diaphana]|uniref:TRAF-type domain-containing protein n=1 Tax=Exaiptasia diaphana TaxID=2652724 RepID=A0A913YI14_EXADI|nr:TNF receptor-associated factor 4 [Exaiptasia diaphana]